MNGEMAELKCSRKSFDRFHNVRRSLSTLASAERFWEQCLLPEERIQLGGTLLQAIRRFSNIIAMWTHLRKVRYQLAVIGLGELLFLLTPNEVDWLLREGGELSRDREEAELQAIERGDLVLVRSTKSAHWKGEELDVAWDRHNSSWQFLLMACEQAKDDCPIDCLNFGTNARENVVAQKKSRLKSVMGFPSELIDYFKVAGRGTQKFTLAPDHIHIF